MHDLKVNVDQLNILSLDGRKENILPPAIQSVNTSRESHDGADQLPPTAISKEIEEDVSTVLIDGMDVRTKTNSVIDGIGALLSSQ